MSAENDTAPSPISLNEVLQTRAREIPNAPAYTFLVDGEEPGLAFTYQEVHRRASGVAQALGRRVRPGDRALLLYDNGLEFITAFLGCLYAGVVGVPSFPPDLARPARSIRRLTALMEDAEPVIGLSTASVNEADVPLFASSPELSKLHWLSTDTLEEVPDAAWEPFRAQRDTVAHLQYTSGSTSSPKGVVLTHANIIANLDGIEAAIQSSPGECVVTWLPPYHDMGLVLGLLWPLYAGLHCVSMPPFDFVARPMRWLRAISRYKAAYSCAPNFAYDLCLGKLRPEDLEQIDLSCWSMAMNGAEPVRGETLRNFSRVFAPCGFQAKAHTPGYGLAEATLMATVTPRSEDATHIYLAKADVERHRVTETHRDDPEGREYVGSGIPYCDTDIRIVDPESWHEKNANEIGEIWIAGGTVAKGYWKNEEATEQDFRAVIADSGQGPFLRTGDLGFLRDGRLYITGRIKDLIIVRGANHYPQDIEATVSRCHKALRPGCAAAFNAVLDGQERIVVVSEVRDKILGEFEDATPQDQQAAAAEIIQTIRRAIAEAHELQAHGVVLIMPRTLMKTSSGKIQRNATRLSFLDGSLSTVAQDLLSAPAEDVPPEVPAAAAEDAPPEVPAAATEETPRDASSQRRQKMFQAYVRSQLAELLSVAEGAIAPDTPLLDFGLDSLMATQFCSRVQEDFAVDLPLTEFLDEPTVASVARGIETAQRTEAKPIVPGRRSGHQPLSFGQERLWFVDQMAENKAAYNIPFALRLAGALNEEALGRALQEIVNRHESLRTTFALVDDRPVQRIASTLEFQLARVALDTSEEGDEETLARWIRGATAEPFNLAQGPLIRATLLELAEADHGLFLLIHHTVADGWSMGVLARELKTLYAAFAAGESSPLPGLPIQYADFAQWQREHLQGEVLEGHLAYWKDRLADLAVLQLPTDHPRPAVQQFDGATEHFMLPKALSEELSALGRREGTTLFMTLLSAFNVLLHRYTGQADIVVGSPIANRHRAEVENLIGFFVNTLVLRGDFSANPTFSELLAQVRDGAMDAYAHQDYPFERLVEELKPTRDTSRNPLAQVFFVFQNFPVPELDMAGVEVKHQLVKEAFSRFDLEFNVWQRDEGLLCALTYSTALFETATIKRLLGHWQTLLQGIVANPGGRVSDLPLLTESEREQLLIEWNQTQADYPQDATIHGLFEAQAHETPKAIALVFGEDTLTYEDLNSRANRAADLLRELGVGPDVLVGLCMERSVEMVVATLAILKAGGAYVPLDPAYPKERLHYMLSDTRAPVVFTQSRLADVLPDGPHRVICLDTEWTSVAQRPDANPDSGAEAANLAYVMYTSGSTGQPKGVCVEHRNVVNLVKGANYTHFGPGEVYLQFATMSFDAATFEVWAGLLNGGKLVVHAPGLPSLQELAAFIQRQGITTLFATTGLFHQLAESPGLLKSLTSVKRVFTGGEVASVDLFRRSMEALDGRPLVNFYGPTEGTAFATFYAMDDVSQVRAPVPIGRPIANTRVYVLDRSLHPVPIGVPGELCIGGDGLARGYLNNPDLTDQRFIANPFSEEPGSRLYKTGDLVRYLPDGNLEFLGRFDHQVKVRGFRIELGEIESVLRQHPAVNESLVLAREDRPGDKRIVAYVVSGQEDIESALRPFLQERLPAYMVPSAFVTLDAMPLRANGKLNRDALPAPDHARAASQGIPTPPRTETEGRLALIWEEILDVEAIGVFDDFFDLGGHSLLAMRLVARIENAFRQVVPLTTLFQSPTIESVARFLESGLKDETEPIVPVSRDADLPASFGQERLWVVDQLSENKSAYIVPFALRMTGALDKDALQRALQEIVIRHESLRTSFPMVNDAPVQHIAPTLEVPLASAMLEAISGEQDEAIEQWVRDETTKPFNLSQGPLIRATLLELDGQDHVLVVLIHHIATDGWSMEVLTRELTALYEAFTAGDASPLPELPIQYADFAVWQRARLKGELLATDASYWKGQLEGLTVLSLPTDFSRPAVQQFHGAIERVRLPKALCEELTAQTRREKVTRYMTLLSAFNVLLHRYSGQDDIAVGSPIANRDRGEVENLIGFFVNTLILRTDFSENPTFLELLAQTKDTAVTAYAHQEYPFERLVEDLNPARDMSRSPLAQVSFAYHNLDIAASDVAGLSFKHQLVGTSATRLDLELHVWEEDEGLLCTFIYCTDLFKPETIRRMATHWQNLLNAIVADPSRPISELPLMAAEERRRMLVEWNDTAQDFPRTKCVHELFEEQVERSPSAIALIFEGEELTYSELNERASRLAHHLRALGVGREDMVGLCMERGIDEVVATSAILKAGGVYVPLDPTYPAPRLAHMLADTRTKIVLTTTSLAEALPPHEGKNLCVDAEREAIAARSGANPESVSTAADLAYVMYTSGSTGQPKGVAVEHRHIVRLVRNTNYVDPKPADVFFHFAPISFDGSTFELWGSLLNGARLVVFPSELPSLEALATTIERQGITTLWITTGLFHQMVDNHLDQLHRVKRIFTGGEVMSVDHMRRAVAALAGCEIVNFYGPTECTTFTSYYPVPELPEAGIPIPVGKPLSNARIYVLDRHRQPVPVGVPGELYIGGDGLAREYLNSPELTAERFIANPLPEEPGDRLYKTGDQVRLLPDGNLDFLGRFDHQVKVRGFRIELGEIESMLQQHPAVSESVVLLREPKPGDKRIVAYLVLDEPCGEDVLRSFLRENLPTYMIPNAFVVLDAIPLTAVGKVDRKALPAPDGVRLASAESITPPRTETERILAGIWEEILELSPIGVHDDFFALGGHSLLGMRLVARIESAFQQTVPLTILFQAPTIAQLGEKLEEPGGLSAQSPVVLLQPAGDNPPFFCLPGIRGEVLALREFSHLLGPNQPFYGVEIEDPDAPIEELARNLIEHIVAAQPLGPYYLAGACFGGLIAFEIACQLAAEGKDVAFLALFDAYALPKDRGRLDILRHRIKVFPRLSAQEQATFLKQTAREVKSTLTEKALLALAPLGLLSESAQLKYRGREDRRTRKRIALQYTPKHYSGPVFLFRTAEGPPAWDALEDVPDNGWGVLCSGEFEVHTLDCGHSDFLKQPHITTLAELLRGCLERTWRFRKALASIRV